MRMEYALIALVAGCTQATCPPALPPAVHVVEVPAQKETVVVVHTPPVARTAILKSYDSMQTEIAHAVLKFKTPANIYKLTQMDKAAQKLLEPLRTHPSGLTQAQLDAAEASVLNLRGFLSANHL